jgi:hypothetical protein
MSRQGGADKRNKERARQEKQRDKAIAREERRKKKEAKPAAAPGEDPDLVGIVWGPQPPAED